MYPAKQSTALTIPVFAHDANGDAVTGLVDGNFTKRISKNGGAFGAMTVTITEMENGWYSLPIGTGHSDTLGVLSITLTSSAKQINVQLRVHARLPDDLAYPATTGRSLDVDASGRIVIQGTLNDLDSLENIAITDIVSDGTALQTTAGALDVCTLVTDVAGFTSAGQAEIQAECNDAIVANGLDHLVGTAVADTDVTDNSIIAKLAASGATADFTSFVWTTDSLQAIRDHIGDGTNLTEAGGDGDHLTAINLPNQTMDITGNLSGSVGSVTGAVGSVTGAVGSVTGNVGGNVVGSVASVTAQVTADMTAISGSTVAADNLEESAEAIIPGAAQTGTLSTTQATSDLTGFVDDELIGRTIIFKSGDANGQASDITDYASASGLLTFTAITTLPANGDLFVVV